MLIQQKVLDGVGSPLSDLIFAPTYGSDYVVKRSPLEAISSGNTKGIELMLGNMADEMSYWSFYDTPESHVCEQTIKENLFTAINPGIEPKLQELYDLYAKNPQRVWKKEGDILLARGMTMLFAFRRWMLPRGNQQLPVPIITGWITRSTCLSSPARTIAHRMEPNCPSYLAKLMNRLVSILLAKRAMPVTLPSAAN